MTDHPIQALSKQSSSSDTSPAATVSAVPRRLSVPNTLVHPRALTDRELTAIMLIGDALIPRVHANPAFTELDDWPRLVKVALAALAEYFDTVATALEPFLEPNHTPTLDRLRELEHDEPEQFFAVSAVICGSYFMSPRIRALLGIPGLEPHPASVMAAADDLEDGILEPVIAKGATYTPTDDCPRR